MTKIKTSTVTTIDCYDLDRIVNETYGKRYHFQQQDGCQGRGTRHVYVPSDGYDFENDTVPEVVNGSEMGVSFKAWLDRCPNKPIANQTDDYQLDLWWNRNFYPSLDMILDDLHEKGIINSGEYTIIINW